MAKKTKPALEDCPCAGGHLDKFTQAAMLSVLASEPLHGYLIVQRLHSMPMYRDQAPDPTGVYRLLKAMENRNLVVCEWNMPQRGPAKKQFRITSRGLECLGKWIGTMEQYACELNGLLAMLKGAPAPAKPAGKCACRSNRAGSSASLSRRKAACR